MMTEEKEDFDVIEIHLENVNHDLKEYYLCEICNKSFENIDKHLDECKKSTAIVYDTNDKASVQKKNYECSECKKSFISSQGFKAHIKRHKNLSEEVLKKLENELNKNLDMCEIIDNSIYRCKVCNTEFNTRKKFLLHKSIHRNINIPNTILKDKLIICEICNRTFKTEDELTLHLNVHNNQEEKLKNSVEKIAGKGIHNCQYCGKEFKRPHEKVKHERVHTKEKPHVCDICGKCFRVSYTLLVHKRNVHSDIRPYICTFVGCNKKFKAQGAYNHHLNTHNTEKKFKCSFCTKSFKTQVQLAGHKNTHTKKFICTICQRRFSTLFDIKKHKKSHENGGGSLKYSCSICGASYARKLSYNYHLNEMHGDEIVEEYIEDSETDELNTEVYSIVME